MTHKGPKQKIIQAVKPTLFIFNGGNAGWIMRITADRRIEVSEDVEVTEAAQKVLDALQHLLLPQQEPVAEIVSDVNGCLSTQWSNKWTPNPGDKLYTSPPQRKPLTDAQERKEFEQWYAENVFDFEANPIGSRECGLQWSAWKARAAHGIKETKRTKLDEMWAALATYQPKADAAGHGESWAKMCKEKNSAAAYAAATADGVAFAAYVAVVAAYSAAFFAAAYADNAAFAAYAVPAVDKWAQKAIDLINEAKENT